MYGSLVATANFTVAGTVRFGVAGHGPGAVIAGHRRRPRRTGHGRLPPARSLGFFRPDSYDTRDGAERTAARVQRPRIGADAATQFAPQMEYAATNRAAWRQMLDWTGQVMLGAIVVVLHSGRHVDRALERRADGRASAATARSASASPSGETKADMCPLADRRGSLIVGFARLGRRDGARAGRRVLPSSAHGDSTLGHRCSRTPRCIDHRRACAPRVTADELRHRLRARPGRDVPGHGRVRDRHLQAADIPAG
ncbi:MAG: hypothetical protein MZV64_42795 [Ignavibacteriales bacterium]|nr:hypothetical protein [Ignavibacteriales bacterium]